MAKQTFTTGQVLTAAQMTSLQQTAMGGGSTTAKTTSYVLVAADAGTTVAMNAAGSTTITVNTSLFSAGDSVFIQNWGAGTCTVTAGTATVTTHGSLALGQWEGGTLYFTSSSAAIFFDISQSAGMTNPMTTTGDTIYSSSGSTPARLGIGSTGNVLTVAGGVPTWAAPAGGGGMTVISSGNLTGSAISVSSITGYKDIQVVLRNYYPSIGGESAYFRLNGNTTSIYTYSMIKGTSTAIDNTIATSLFGLDDNLTSPKNASNGNSVVFNVYDIASTTGVKLVSWQNRYIDNPSNAKKFTANFGYWDSTSAVTEVNINMGGGANFSGGTYIVYGVN